ncbi:C-terminal binding protein [Thermostilla marina]
MLTDFIDDDLAIERRVLGELAEVEALAKHHESELEGLVEDADVLIVFHELSVTRATIDRLQRCRLIVRAGVGVDNVDGEAARRRGIPLANVPDYGSEEVADTAIGMALALARGIHLLNSRLIRKRGPWSYEQAVPILRLRGRVFGIVGLGRIGTAAACRAKALGMDVVFYDPYKPDGYDRALGIWRAETLTDLLSQVHILSIHCPATEETRGMINAEALAAMPEGAYLVNTARGAIVDPAAVLAAIESGRLAGAALDVLPQEPPSEDDPLIAAWRNPDHPAHDRIILNPHAAFYCVEGLEDIRRKTAEAARRAILGEPLRNIVN